MSVKVPNKNLMRRTFSLEQIAHQRIALVTLSLVLIIYALAGGSVKSEVTLLNLPIEFRRPKLLLYAAWAIWCYFLYRYLLVTDPPWRSFMDEIRLRSLADIRVQALCLPALKRFDVPSAWRATAHRQSADGWTFAITKRSGTYHFDPGQFFRPTMQCIPSGAAGQIGYFPLTTSEMLIYRFALLRATLTAIALEMTFSEVILPYVLVCLTPVVWCVAYWRVVWEWLGGML